MRKKPAPPALWIALTIPVLWLALIAASVYENGMNVFELVGRLTAAANRPFAVRWTAYTPRFLLVFLLLQEADAPQKPLIACNQLVQVGEENISIRRVRRRIDPLSHHADQLFLRVLRDLLQRNHAVAQPRHLTAQLFHLLRPVRQLVHLTVVESGETLLPRA